MSMQNQHLSEDELEDLLLGQAGAAVAEHHAACALCSSKSQAFAALMADFNQSTLEWSHARSARLPRPAGNPKAAGTARPHLFAVPAYAFAASLLVLLTLLFTQGMFTRSTPHHGLPQAHMQQDPAIQPVSSHAATDPQIASDNNLLAEIDAALDQPDPASLSLERSLANQPISARAR